MHAHSLPLRILLLIYKTSCYPIMTPSPFPVSANSSMYAHYVFNTLDQKRTGIVSFEVRRSGWPFNQHRDWFHLDTTTEWLVYEWVNMVGWRYRKWFAVQLDKVTYLLCNELSPQSGQRDSLGNYITNCSHLRGRDGACGWMMEETTIKLIH